MDRTVPKGAALLLDFIREIEVGRSDRASYDIIYGHNQGKLAKPVTATNIGDLVDMQASFTKRFGSSATGGYQFMRRTLQDLARELGLSGREMFDPDLQDRLAYHLLKRRCYEAYMAGQISRIEFGRRLAMEWASFPVLAATKGAHRQLGRGQSYYVGDGVNKALVSPERMEAMLDRVKAVGNVVVHETPARDTQPPLPSTNEPQPEKLSTSKRFWTWISTGGGTAVLPFVDWRVQFLIVVVVVGFAVYAIATMPAVRKKIGLV